MDAPSRPGLRRLAVLTALSFGCATVRTPVGSLAEAEPVAHGAIARPQIELWLESGGDVPLAEQDDAYRRARAALESALEGRGDGGEDAPYVLYVRERAVARTGSRKTDQALAITGIVIGAVAIVAVVVVMVASGKGGGAPSLPKGSAARVAAAPAHIRPIAVPAPPRIVPVPVPLPNSAPVRPAGAARIVVEPPPVDVWVDAVAEMPAPEEGPPEPLAADAWSEWDAAPAAALPPEAPALPAAGAPAEAVPAPDLPPAATLALAERGYFAGEELVLDLVLVERSSGLPVWTKVVRRGDDPRDAAAVSRALDEGLRDLGLARASR